MDDRLRMAVCNAIEWQSKKELVNLLGVIFPNSKNDWKEYPFWYLRDECLFAFSLELCEDTGMIKNKLRFTARFLD